MLQAYGGGIDLGTVAVDAKRLCRSSLAVQNLQASSDRRLGKGKSTRWAVPSARSSARRFREGRFVLSLEEQIKCVFQRSLMSETQRHGGWDLVAFDAVIVGPRGAGVLVDVDRVCFPWRMTIAIDDAQLGCRENLALLARCPGLSLRSLGRLRLEAEGELDLIAIAPTESSIEDSSNVGRPGMILSLQWKGLCNMGLDRLQRHHFTGIQRWSDEIELVGHTAGPVSPKDGLDSLRRRLNGPPRGGRVAIPALGSSTHRREQRRLQQSYQTTAAQLLEVLAISASHSQDESRSGYGGRSDQACSLEDAYLACAHYLQAARIHFESKIWLRGFSLSCYQIVFIGSNRFRGNGFRRPSWA